MSHQHAADATTAPLGDHEEILEIQTRAAKERREVVKEEREADDGLAGVREDDFGGRTVAEQPGAQALFRRHDFIGHALVVGECLDQAQDDRNVL